MPCLISSHIHTRSVYDDEAVVEFVDFLRVRESVGGNVASLRCRLIAHVLVVLSLRVLLDQLEAAKGKDNVTGEE